MRNFKWLRKLSVLLLKPQVSLTVTHGVSVVGVAGWPATGDGGRGQPAADAERYRCRWLCVVMGIIVASSGGFLVFYYVKCFALQMFWM